MSTLSVDVAALRARYPLPVKVQSAEEKRRLREERDVLLRWAECDLQTVLSMVELAHLSDHLDGMRGPVVTAYASGTDVAFVYKADGGWKVKGELKPLKDYRYFITTYCSEEPRSGLVVNDVLASMGIADADEAVAAVMPLLPVFSTRSVSNLPRLLCRLPRHSVVSMLAYGRRLAVLLGVGEDEMEAYASILAGWIEGRDMRVNDWPLADLAEKSGEASQTARSRDVSGIATCLAAADDILFLRHALDLGADANGNRATYGSDFLPLVCAVENGNISMMGLLVERGAEVTFANPVTGEADPRLCEALLDGVGSVRFTEDEGRETDGIVRYAGDMILDFLIGVGADIEAVPLFGGYTPTGKLEETYGKPALGAGWLQEAYDMAARIEAGIEAVSTAPRRDRAA